MITEDQQAKTQSVCYTVDMKMNQESLYHMVSVEKHLNPSAPLPTGCRAVHAYSQISHICETQQCLVLYTMDHGGYLLDKRQMGAVCINGLRTFLSERSGKSVKWIQVRDYIPVKSN